MVATLYILKCSDGSYYTGITRKDLASRVSEHQQGIYDGYTARRRPVELVYNCTFERLTEAIAGERQVKGWRREKKEALICGKFDLLPKLSKRGAKTGGWKTTSSSFETGLAALLRMRQCIGHVQFRTGRL
ncbi:GIY-YIG nuclease superfamily protein [Roseibium album]|nr:GIY-YIG nuclease superfamily protein [Roseibium album]